MLGAFQVFDVFRELEEQIQKKARCVAVKELRKEDINYLIDNKIQGHEFDKKQFKKSISQIDSFEILDRLYKYANFKHPNIVELKQKMYELLSLFEKKITRDTQI